MRRSCILLGLVAGVLLTIAPKPAAADCGVWHTECVYICTEYYPNGTDCRKTKKICYNVCDDFDVKKSHTMAPLEKQRTAAIAQQADATLTVTGRLRKIFAIGGETTGWLLELDSPLFYQDKKFPSIELDPRGNDLRKLTNKRVRVKGRIEWREGVERGMYPVLVAESVGESPPKTGD